MRTGVTLATLRKEVQFEAGLSSAPGHSTQHAERIDHRLNRVEREVALNYTWPTRTIERNVIVGANAQFAVMPVNLTFTMIKTVWCLYAGDQWSPVTHGIGAAERSAVPYTRRQQTTRRWEILSTASANYVAGVAEFEVWPISPVAETLRFTGEVVPGEMSLDTHTCVMDADVLVLIVAGEMLAKADPETAKVLLAKAQARITKLQARQVGMKLPEVNLAGRPRSRPRAGLDYMPPRG